jgi:hypothetical protein
VKACFAKSDTGRWWTSYRSHPQGARGRTFWNHWYNKPYCYSAAAEAVVPQTNDDYSAMSEKEMFANCYAEYFKDPAGFADHSLWGGDLSADVKGLMTAHVLDRQPYKGLPAAGPAAGANPDAVT